jgi:pSer/pThr/pTyr-binding forkhead associated (FHA) protein
MAAPPNILVQLIHIEGPLKGEILELTDSEILIGRHPSCQLRFPPDFTVVSRKHATITREGNRFKLADHSANGTYVNGKRIEEVYLRDGDVLTISEGGPKVSFLTQIREKVPRPVESAPSTPREKPGVQPERMQPPPPPRPQEPRAYGIAEVPLVIQYGPTLRSFKKIPVKLGRGASCDFTLDGPAILDQHAEIFFAEGQYWVKDLTGRKSIAINGKPIDLTAPLNPDDQLTLSPEGPIFLFLGEGRLAEVEPPAESGELADSAGAKQASPQAEENKSPSFKGAKSIFKKYLHR